MLGEEGLRTFPAHWGLLRAPAERTHSDFFSASGHRNVPCSGSGEEDGVVPLIPTALDLNSGDHAYKAFSQCQGKRPPSLNPSAILGIPLPQSSCHGLILEGYILRTLFLGKQCPCGSKHYCYFPRNAGTAGGKEKVMKMVAQIK